VDSFWQDAWKSFKAVSGPILTGAAFLLALLGPLYAPAAALAISLIWLAAVGLIVLAVLLAMLNMVLAARRAAGGRLPKTRDVVLAAEGTTGTVTLVLDRSALFGFNALVTIYHVERLDQGREDVFERLIGVGRISNIQQNGLIQVLVLVEMPLHAELWQRVRNREASVIGQLVVKPSIPFGAAGMEVRFSE
jgi:hypothetical protein